MNDLSTLSDRDARNWAMLCHLTALLLFVGVPFGNVIGPLAVWMVKGKESPLVDDNGREAVNFGITMTILYAVLGAGALLWLGVPVLMAALNQGVAALVALVWGFLPSLAAFLIFPLVHFLLIVVGAIRAANGAYHRYPFTIRFIQ